MLKFILKSTLIILNLQAIAVYAAKVKKEYTIMAPDSNRPRFDPSGIFLYQDKLLVVSDRPEYNDIYELKETQPGILQASIFLKLQPSKFEFKDYFDFEGLCFCKNKFLIAEETTRSLIWVNPTSGEARIETPDLKAIHKEKEISFSSEVKGAGFEGVACDEVHNRVYIANERSFRMIYVFDLETNKIIDLFDVPAGEFPKLLEGFKVFPDFSDLFFSKDKLWAIHRHAEEILKIDPVKQSVVKRYRIPVKSHSYFSAREPFGMSEGLVVKEEKNKINFFLLYDNNDNPSTKDPNNKNAKLIEFSLPQ